MYTYVHIIIKLFSKKFTALSWDSLWKELPIDINFTDCLSLYINIMNDQVYCTLQK